MVNLLLSKGVDPDSKDNFHQTSLSYAVTHRWENLVILLLSKGADAGYRDSEGQTPLSRAISENHKGSHEGIIKLLRASVRPDPNDKDAHD